MFSGYIVIIIRYLYLKYLSVRPAGHCLFVRCLFVNTHFAERDSSVLNEAFR